MNTHHCSSAHRNKYESDFWGTLTLSDLSLAMNLYGDLGTHDTQVDRISFINDKKIFSFRRLEFGRTIVSNVADHGTLLEVNPEILGENPVIGVREDNLTRSLIIDHLLIDQWLAPNESKSESILGRDHLPSFRYPNGQTQSMMSSRLPTSFTWSPTGVINEYLKSYCFFYNFIIIKCYIMNKIAQWEKGL